MSGRKNGDCSRKFRRHQDSGHDSSVCRPNGFAAQDQSSKCRFPRSALQTSPYDDRKNTKISTTCMYYREILTVRALRSSRTIEYYVLLSLRIIEKRKDWIWIGFQSGPAFFVRTIENYVLLSIRTIEKWLYRQAKQKARFSSAPASPRSLRRWCVVQDANFGQHEMLVTMECLVACPRWCLGHCDERIMKMTMLSAYLPSTHTRWQALHFWRFVRQFWGLTCALWFSR